MSKKKYLAGYSPEDWIIIESTEENQMTYSHIPLNEYDSFSEAKQAILEIVRKKIQSDRHSLKFLRSMKKSDADNS